MALVEDTNLFVGGIDSRFTEAVLAQYFGRFGAIDKVTIIYDKEGMTRGYGFVQYYTYEACNNAAREMYHTILGKRVNVNIASLGTALKRPGGIPRGASKGGRGGKKRVHEPHADDLRSPLKKPRAEDDKVLGPPIIVPSTATFLAQLASHGIHVTLEEASEKLDELRENEPLEAFKYFLEVSDLFKQSPTFDTIYEQLLEGARKVRVAQALDEGYTEGLAKTHAHLIA